MSNCISLISCDGTCSNIHDIRGTSRTLLLPFVDSLVNINGDTDCTYYVRESFFVGFVIDTTEFLCSNPNTNPPTPNLLSTLGSVTYLVESLIYNGVQYVNTSVPYTITYGDFQCFNCGPSNIGSAICLPSSSIPGSPNATNAHSNALNNLFQGLNLDLQVFPYGTSGATVIRLFNSDQFQIQIRRIGSYQPGVYTLTLNNTGLNVEFNNTEITAGIVYDTTDTCVRRGPGPTILSATTASTCDTTTTYPDYIPVSDCDVLTIFPMGVTCSITNTFQSTGATRTATLVVTGGTPPYTFEWENGNRTDTIRNLPAGTYNATVTDYFGDFVVNTSCELPPIDCSLRNIELVPSYTCQYSSGLLNGSANLSLIVTGGIRPYTFSGSVNGVPTTFTNNMVVFHSNILEITPYDRDGCSGITKALIINCPPATPPPPPSLSGLCDGQILCLVSPYTFQLNVTASTEVVSVFGGIGASVPKVKFNLNLSSSNYSKGVMGSYKIYYVDTPNTFLNNINFTSFTTYPITWTGYSSYAEYGSPAMKLSDYVEFGFTQLTPANPTIYDDPWTLEITPYTQYYGQYSTPINGLIWIPTSTNLQIDVVVLDEDGCVHTGSGIIQIPVNNNSNTLTINF